VFASLAEVPGPIDIVLVFRRSENVRAHSQEILDCGPAVLWLQDGVRDDALAGEARARGIQVVQDDCIARRYAEWLLERGA
jgi:predicted CoA-binding protein